MIATSRRHNPSFVELLYGKTVNLTKNHESKEAAPLKNDRIANGRITISLR